ncbi:dihydroneopterin aldolase/dihydroneopterin aldolase/2-amino-4-hydroxy-6-hydroxymethyldihydropteridine diphosphokinase [Ruminiclostridium sufflavum DSM 19573]|uniref:7,8-dihydroneopterin aldolase n=1 Tax=Ruminiclostridium sufflavum DSM 19573 TaxID=1121337 RepID=A0A318XL67_9FIRM|nr:dihydroneopterin aldolase [Ruminiclostridium sufflavum]PYG87123.1 dihydroneopterin aldolase/dihydroneopterin aldolase/2-amino-4-hydroxy-6-hydroxymethyldihydropteridine diphosphokinase [Ruminiclostridium sufflavum DSM 19573]
MDKIIVEGLEVYAYHGVAQEEKTLGQMFIISLEIGVDLEKSARSGNLKDTINYSSVCKSVTAVLQSGSYDLIETAAFKIIEELFRNFKLAQAIRILLKKPWAPMGQHLKYAAVELERKRGDFDEA